MTDLVSVFVGGAQKAGTRSVAQYLRQHPNVVVHQSKEGHFFDRDKHFNDSTPDAAALDTYHQGFHSISSDQIRCDITPDYLYRPSVIERIHAYNPKAQWIILLRNPIERAYSAWNMEVNRQTENLSFEEALRAELDGSIAGREHDRFHYISRGQYHHQLQRLWQYFPQSQCHVFSAEALWENPRNLLNQVAQTIGIDCNDAAQYQHTHKGKYRSPMSDDSREWLAQHFKTELNDLPKLLNWQENPWTD